MLSTAVHPPTTEHVYAQWQERKELLSRPPLGLLQDDNGLQTLDIKEEDAASPMSGDSLSRNHFKNSRTAKLKGNPVLLISWWEALWGLVTKDAYFNLSLLLLLLLQEKEADFQKLIWTLGGPKRMKGSAPCVRNMEISNPM